MLRVGKLRHREVRSLAQGHTTSKCGAKNKHSHLAQSQGFQPLSYVALMPALSNRNRTHQTCDCKISSSHN